MKHLTRFRTVLILTGLSLLALAINILMPGTSLRAENSAAPKKRETVHGPRVRTAPKLLSPKAINSTTITEIIAQNVTLAPGDDQQFYAQSDFSGVDRVNLAFYATPDQDLSKTNYLVWWAVPNAANYSVVDYVQGQYFAFLNSGGATLLPYGNQLLIEARNNGTQSATISQITVFGVAR
jgi:hypothetical protein